MLANKDNSCSSLYVQLTVRIRLTNKLTVIRRVVLWLVHTADADKTRLFSLVRVGGVNKPLGL